MQKGCVQKIDHWLLMRTGAAQAERLKIESAERFQERVDKLRLLTREHKLAAVMRIVDTIEG